MSTAPPLVPRSLDGATRGDEVLQTVLALEIGTAKEIGSEMDLGAGAELEVEDRERER